MHDPSTVAFEIRWPWRRRHRNKEGQWIKGDYKPSIITIWHEDPESDGSDDSCGWFQRSRHGSKDELQKIVKAFEFDWDRTFTMSNGEVITTGFFWPETGLPTRPSYAIGVCLFGMAIQAIYRQRGYKDEWRRAAKFMHRHLYDILIFSDNPVDSINDSIKLLYGDDGFTEAPAAKRTRMRQERIENMAACIYGWILRHERPWYRHPRWHIWHWRLQIHGVQKFKRWAFSRCSKCKRRFRYRESPVSGQWDSPGPRWFRGEENVFHSSCSGHDVETSAKAAPENPPV